MWKFCGKAQFPQSFEQIARNYVETVPFHKNSTPGSKELTILPPHSSHPDSEISEQRTQAKTKF